jgi:drug/metabolite transporter (DMT)-like permease
MLSADVHPGTRALLLRGIGVILLASVLFGAMAVCVRLAGDAMSPLQIAFVRFVGSLAVLLGVTRGRGLRPQPGNFVRLVQRGLLGATSICLYYLGIHGAGAGLATLLHCTYPVWTVLLAAAFLREPIYRSAVWALGLNLVGVFIVLGPGAELGEQTLVGAGYALCASVLAGGAVATARHLRGSEDASLITTYFMSVGAVLTAPTVLAGLPPLSWPLLAALAGVVVTSVAGQWLLHHGLGFTTAAQGSLTAATSVVSAALLEALVFGQSIAPQTFVGAALMVIAVGLAARRA